MNKWECNFEGSNLILIASVEIHRISFYYWNSPTLIVVVRLATSSQTFSNIWFNKLTRCYSYCLRKILISCRFPGILDFFVLAPWSCFQQKKVFELFSWVKFKTFDLYFNLIRNKFPTRCVNWKKIGPELIVRNETMKTVRVAEKRRVISLRIKKFELI